MKKIKFFIALAVFLRAGISTAANTFPSYSASFIGTRPAERIGYALSEAGDINKDGYDDFLIATFHYNYSAWDRGAVYVILGKPKNQFVLNKNIANGAAARFVGRYGYDSVGYEVCSGDVNGDGYTDIIAGAPDGSANVVNPGYGYVIFGKPNIDWGLDVAIQDASDVMIAGEKNKDSAGYAVTSVKDMDGDGCDEFMISMPYADSNGDNNIGKVSLFKGKKTGWVKNISVTNCQASFTTTQNGAFVGMSVSGVGDVNHDGIQDFAIGAGGANRCYLFFGRTAMDWGQGYNVNNANVIFTPDIGATRWGPGWMVRPLGDVNRDGIDDFGISDYSYDSNRGKVYIIFGRTNFPAQMSLSDVSASFVGEKGSDEAGYRFCSPGDYNRDGFSDILIGSHGFDYQADDDGKAYLIYGKASGWQLNQDLSTIPDYQRGEGASSIKFGGYVSGVGDVNNDGAIDFAVSASFYPYQDITTASKGKVFLYFGVPSIDIEGTCYYENSTDGIASVDMQITGSETSECSSDASGVYHFYPSSSGPFHIEPTKASNEDIGQGTITSYDAALVARYSIGLIQLESDQMLRADVNEDGEVNLIDAFSIARFTVGIPNLASSKVGYWRFSPEFRDYSSLTDKITGEDYSAYIIGNVEGSWDGGIGKGIGASEQQDAFHINCSNQEGKQIFTISYTDDEPLYACDFIFNLPEEDQGSFNAELCDPVSGCYLFSNRSETAYRISLFAVYPIRSGTELIQLAGNYETKPQAYFESIKYTYNSYPFTEYEMDDSLKGHALPEGFSLLQNYPNPFNGGTDIQFELPADSDAELQIFNMLGQPIRTFTFMDKKKGDYFFHWDGLDFHGRNAPSGVYIVQLKAGSEHRRIKVIKLD